MKNFSDHASNERTFLSWVRTSIAIMGFGFVVEKIGLLQPSADQAAAKASGLFGTVGEYSGPALILVGLALMVAATVRFLALRKSLNRDMKKLQPSIWINVSLAILLGLLGVAVAVYMTHLAIK